MASIIRGTTPTIRYTFTEIDPADLTAAVLTIRQGNITLEKDLTMAVRDEGSLAWELTQSETLAFTPTTARIRCNWLLNDGTRGASKVTTANIEDNDHDEVMA